MVSAFIWPFTEHWVGAQQNTELSFTVRSWEQGAPRPACWETGVALNFPFFYLYLGSYGSAAELNLEASHLQSMQVPAPH